MRKQKKGIQISRKRIVAAIVINTVIIAIMAILSVYIYYHMVEVEQQSCWEALEESAAAVEDQINTRLEDNINILKLVANAMVMEDHVTKTQSNVDAITAHLEVYQRMTIFNRIDILFENGEAIIQNEEIGQSVLDFEELAGKGVHFSGRLTDVVTGKECIVCVVPVIRQEKTVAMLLGVILCEDMPKYFQSMLYDGQSIVCLVDRPSGDFIMDDWHDTLGNVYEESKRKPLPGYEKVDIREEIFQGNTGVVAYKSKVNGKASYMYFCPIEKWDWSMVVVAQEDEVFYSLGIIKRLLTYMAVMEMVLLFSYLIWTVLTLNNVLKSKEESEKQSYIDSLTGIYNRNKYIQTIEEYEQMGFPGIGVLFMDLNNLKEINDKQGHSAGDQLIQRTAAALSSIFGTSVYRIGGDEFVVCASNFSQERFSELAERARKLMEEEHIDMAFGVTWRVNSSSIREQLQEADERMYQEKEICHKRRENEER